MLDTGPQRRCEAWSDELDRRAAEVDRGEVELLDARQVMADIRADLKDS